MVEYSHQEADLPAETYSTEEAAAKLGISKSTILRWLKKGYDEKVRRDRNGWRVFTAADVKAIKKAMGL